MIAIIICLVTYTKCQDEEDANSLSYHVTPTEEEASVAEKKITQVSNISFLPWYPYCKQYRTCRSCLSCRNCKWCQFRRHGRYYRFCVNPRFPFVCPWWGWVWHIRWCPPYWWQLIENTTLAKLRPAEENFCTDKTDCTSCLSTGGCNWCDNPCPPARLGYNEKPQCGPKCTPSDTTSYCNVEDHHHGGPHGSCGCNAYDNNCTKCVQTYGCAFCANEKDGIKGDCVNTRNEKFACKETLWTPYEGQCPGTQPYVPEIDVTPQENDGTTTDTKDDTTTDEKQDPATDNSDTADQTADNSDSTAKP